MLLVHGADSRHTASAWWETKSYCQCVVGNQVILSLHVEKSINTARILWESKQVILPFHDGKPSHPASAWREKKSQCRNMLGNQVYCHFMMGNQDNAPSALWEAEVYCQCHGRKWHKRTNKSPEAPYVSSRLYMMLIKANYGATHAHNSCM
jgi:hypothetical protein